MLKKSLQKSLEILRGNLSIFSIWLVYHVLGSLFMTFFFTSQIKQYDNFANLPWLIWIFLIFSPIAYFYLHAGTLGYVRNQLMLRSPNLSDFFFTGMKYFTRLLLFCLVCFFLIVVCAFLLGAVNYGIFYFAELAQIEFSRFAILSFPIGIACTFILITIWFGLHMLYGPTLIVANDSRVFNALKKSIKIVRKHLKISLGISGLITLQLLFVGILANLIDESGFHPIIQVAFIVLNGIVNSFFQVYLTIVIMNVYFKLKEKELDQV